LIFIYDYLPQVEAAAQMLYVILFLKMHTWRAAVSPCKSLLELKYSRAAGYSVRLGLAGKKSKRVVQGNLIFERIQ
jgi:hypothetical protein